MADKCYLAVDPGAKGAICALSIGETTSIEFIDITMHPLELVQEIERLKDAYDVRVIMIEDVHALPKVSAKSNFNFGYNLGNIVGALSTTAIKIDRVPPKTWQKSLRVTKSGTALKKEVAAKMKELYPLAELTGARGGLLDGRSDSLAIADYAYHKYKESR